MALRQVIELPRVELMEKTRELCICTITTVWRQTERERESTGLVFNSILGQIIILLWTLLCLNSSSRNLSTSKFVLQLEYLANVTSHTLFFCFFSLGYLKYMCVESIILRVFLFIIFNLISLLRTTNIAWL